mmetsp:Transcript_36495/g.91004  ORF Transcript_36495/g.91004 Transcript_36495/m.91004 type:complete len:291 (+) Transcript_36495:742-1614(+)
MIAAVKVAVGAQDEDLLLVEVREPRRDFARVPEHVAARPVRLPRRRRRDRHRHDQRAGRRRRPASGLQLCCTGVCLPFAASVLNQSLQLVTRASDGDACRAQREQHFERAHLRGASEADEHVPVEQRLQLLGTRACRALRRRKRARLADPEGGPASKERKRVHPRQRGSRRARGAAAADCNGAVHLRRPLCRPLAHGAVERNRARRCCKRARRRHELERGIELCESGDGTSERALARGRHRCGERDHVPCIAVAPCLLAIDCGGEVGLAGGQGRGAPDRLERLRCGHRTV